MARRAGSARCLCLSDPRRGNTFTGNLVLRCPRSLLSLRLRLRVGLGRSPLRRTGLRPAPGTLRCHRRRPAGTVGDVVFLNQLAGRVVVGRLFDRIDLLLLLCEQLAKVVLCVVNK